MKQLLPIMAAALLAAGNLHSSPYTYSYTGDFYTSSTSPDIPGLQLTDRITASFTIDDSLWGQELHNQFAVPLFSGGVSGDYANRVTTDLLGRIISWGISGDSSGIDSASYGFLDGSGFDFMAGERFSQGERYDVARVDYAPGSPSRWVIRPVPEGGSTLAYLALGALLLFWRKPKVG